MVLAVCLEVSAAQAVSAVPAVPATRGMDVMTMDVMTSSGKHWTLLIGEDQTNSSSKKLKRGVTKRIGSMADMRSFLKFIRLFRQSRGVFGQFAKPKRD